MGSKTRIAKHLLRIMLKDRKPLWIEPFVGGGNMIDKVTGWRIGADINEYLIAALTLIRDDPHSLPKNKAEFTEQDYKNIKQSNNKAMVGYAGFALSYGGKWFGGYRRDRVNKRDYINEAYRNAIRQSEKLQGVELVCCSYENLIIPEISTLYCDIPYAKTTKYKTDFDHDKFWEWCRNKAKEGHDIWVSEYSAPSDFVCVWSGEITSSLTKDTGSKVGVEKLFKYVG